MPVKHSRKSTDSFQASADFTHSKTPLLPKNKSNFNIYEKRVGRIYGLASKSLQNPAQNGWHC